MASGSPVETPAGKPSQVYACKCLNVQMTSSTQAPASSSEGTRDPAYEPIFVDDEGIAIAHPQVTVRTTTRAEPIPGTSRYSRFTILTCLLCQLPAYRVFQTISLEIQGNESILLPTDDWVERDILKSSTGWIQVHKDGIVGDSISQAKASPSYSLSFSLLLPTEPLSLIPSSSPKSNTETSLSNSAELPTQPCLPVLRPLFFPPPFTPSHPIFIHLASIANEESQNLRGAAEQRIADFVKAEMAAIEAREQSLRHQVEVFWTTYKNHLNALQGETSKQTLNVTRSHVSQGGFGPGGLSAGISSSSVSIRNFNPVPISPLSPPSSGPRTSALSASLATSTFHHLNTKANEARTHSSGYSGSDTPSTTYSKSPTLIPDAVPVGNNNVLQYKRNVNDDINTQASYRYFVNLEEDMARYKRSQEVALKGQQEAEAGKRAQEQTPVQAGSSSVNANVNLKHKATKPQTTTDAKPEEIVLPRDREKGKRKVTFDVEPAVMTIETEADGKVEEDVTTDQDSGDMLFSLEDLEGEEDTGDSSDIQPSSLPLLEQAVSRPLRPKTIRPQTNNEIFSSLRPSSLPNPSHIRPMRGQPHVDSSSHSMLPRPKVLITPTPSGSRSPPLHHGLLSPQIPSEHDAELLRLVAADTPSHRGAWAPNSKAWRTFIRRQDLKEDVDRNGRILEEGEEAEETDSDEGRSPVVTRDKLADDDYNGGSHPISSSVPITIVVRNQLPETEPLNLSSYRPKTNASIPNQQPRSSSNGDHAPPLLSHGGQKMPSSTSIRKAKYAERDRARAMDPGTLDFATLVEEEEDEGETPTNQMTGTPGERSRKLALKILMARNELPEDGTWRSMV